MQRRSQSSGSATRQAILEAAMRGFAQQGFEATSIRGIAERAGSNVASISYHFGGKEGLRAACAEHVVALMSQVLAGAGPDAPVPEAADAAEAALAGLVRSMVRFMLLKPEAQLVAGFLLREMAQPSEVLDTIYRRLFAGVHGRACAFWGAATGQAPESEAVRLAVFAMIGQIVYFHVGKPVVQRRMEWPAIGPAEAGAVADTLVGNLRARLRADRERTP